MANYGFIQVPSNLSNLTNPKDIVRYFAAFASQVANSFNGLLATKPVWGVIGLSGAVLSGSSNFGSSLVSTGTYYIAYREEYSGRPSVTATACYGANASPNAITSGSSSIGFNVLVYNSSAVLVNNEFSFIAMGAR